MAKNQNSNGDMDLGKYARHPRRTAGGAFLIGTAIGATMMAAKKARDKNPVEKLFDNLGR